MSEVTAGPGSTLPSPGLYRQTARQSTDQKVSAQHKAKGEPGKHGISPRAAGQSLGCTQTPAIFNSSPKGKQGLQGNAVTPLTGNNYTFTVLHYRTGSRDNTGSAFPGYTQSQAARRGQLMIQISEPFDIDQEEVPDPLSHSLFQQDSETPERT